MSNTVLPGRYRHYRGKEYQVIDIARHSETEEPLVIYRCRYGNFSLWARPLADFTAPVDIDGESVPRFTYLGNL